MVKKKKKRNGGTGKSFPEELRNEQYQKKSLVK